MNLARQGRERAAPGSSKTWRWCGPWLALGLLLGGCLAEAPRPYPLVSVPDSPQERLAGSEELVTKSYAVVDAMLMLLKDYIDPNLPIIPASFVNLNNTEETSTLGRLLARQMASRLTQRGFAVTEIKLRRELFIQEKTGELMLSRDLSKIVGDHSTQAALVGSYVVAQNTVYVTAQLVRLRDRMVLAAQDFDLPLRGNVKKMLEAQRG